MCGWGVIITCSTKNCDDDDNEYDDGVDGGVVVMMMMTMILKMATSIRASAIAFLILFHSTSNYPGSSLSLSSSNI